MDFDPYRQWLSLDDQPSNFYVLLGLQPLEADADLIRATASQVISRVRNAKPGNHIAAWTRLLDQIEQAREALCDPDKKQIYDQVLRSAIDAQGNLTSSSSADSSRPQTMSPHAPDPMSPLDDGDLPGEQTPPIAPPDSVPTIRRRGIAARRPTRSRRRVPGRTRRGVPWAKPIALVVGAVAFLSVAWALWFALQSNERLLSVLFNRRPESPPLSDEMTPNQPTLPQNARPVPKPNGSLDPASGGRIVPADKPSHRRPVTAAQPDRDRADSAMARSSADGASQESPQTEPASLRTKVNVEGVPRGKADAIQLTDQELRQFRRSLREARRLLTTRQFDQSKQHLARAQQLAKTPELAAMVKRLDTLHQYVQGFWLAVEDGMKEIENTELVLDGSRMYVVELSPRELVVRVEGRNRRFDRDKLPTKLAVAIADRWFDQHASSTKVFKGAFMAVTPGFSEQQVRRLWRQAEREGADLGDLILVLDDRMLDDRDWNPPSEGSLVNGQDE